MKNMAVTDGVYVSARAVVLGHVSPERLVHIGTAEDEEVALRERRGEG